jgi:hypothetical protein
VEICSPDSNSYVEYLNTERLVSTREHDDGTLFCRVLKTLKVKDFNVGVASAISSYARLKLHALLTDIRAAGGKIHYCDTGSVICDINLNDHPDLKDEYQWDGDGTELGSLKNECDEVVEKKLKKVFPDSKEAQKRAFGALVAMAGLDRKRNFCAVGARYGRWPGGALGSHRELGEAPKRSPK